MYLIVLFKFNILHIFLMRSQQPKTRNFRIDLVKGIAKHIIKNLNVSRHLSYSSYSTYYTFS